MSKTELLGKEAQDRFLFNNQRETIKEQQEQRLLLPYAGGLFKITPELMAFVNFWRTTVPGEDLVIKDSYSNPIKIDDPLDFVKTMAQRYKEVMNDWLNEYDELRKVRRVKDV